MWRPKVLRIALDSALGAVDDEQAADRRVEAAPNQVVEQGLHHGSVLRRPLDHAERMFSAVPVDADCGQQHQVFLDVDAVDLDDQQASLDRSAAIHSFMRSADSATNRRDTADLVTPAPFGAAMSPPSGPPGRTSESTR